MSSASSGSQCSDIVCKGTALSINNASKPGSCAAGPSTPPAQSASRPNRTYAIGVLRPILVGCLDALTSVFNVIARTRCRIQSGRSYP
ncbi:MAG: hypothetical protein EPN32_08685 [Rhodanobacter sp.]|nr:MAG: hypothetical protein EPN32_08685 [Rhodanobacter sp.]